MSIFEEFAKSMGQLGPFEEKSVIAIGVSGGSDSLALLCLLSQWTRQMGGDVYAITVDHQLRVESEEEVRFVAGVAKKMDIKHIGLKWEYEQKPLANIQEQARIARLTLLTQWCREHNVMHLVLAHHADDQAETFILNLTRGSGLKGLSGIKPLALFNKVRILRPLLSFTKKQLEDYLKSYIDHWVQDPSNQDPRYKRAVVRNLLQSSLFSDLTDGSKELLQHRINLAISHLARVDSMIDDMVQKASKLVILSDSERKIEMDYLLFKELYQEVALRLLAECLMKISCRHDKTPRFTSLKRLYDLLLSNEVCRNYTLWDCKISRSLKTKIIAIVPEYSEGIKR